MNKKTLLEQLHIDVPFNIKRYVKIRNAISVKIIKYLEDKKLSQKDLAQKLGMKESRLSKILAGNANLTLKAITNIEMELNQELIEVPVNEHVEEMNIEAMSNNFNWNYTNFQNTYSGSANLEINSEDFFQPKEDFINLDDKLNYQGTTKVLN